MEVGPSMIMSSHVRPSPLPLASSTSSAVIRRMRPYCSRGSEPPHASFAGAAHSDSETGRDSYLWLGDHSSRPRSAPGVGGVDEPAPRTWTEKRHEAELPQASVAEQDTEVLPAGNEELEAREHVTGTGPQLSVAETSKE